MSAECKDHPEPVEFWRSAETFAPGVVFREAFHKPPPREPDPAGGITI
jgi:hypothetical protein